MFKQKPQWFLALLLASGFAAAAPGMCPAKNYVFECSYSSDLWNVYNIDYPLPTPPYYLNCLKQRPTIYKCTQLYTSGAFLGGTYTSYKVVLNNADFVSDPYPITSLTGPPYGLTSAYISAVVASNRTVQRPLLVQWSNESVARSRNDTLKQCSIKQLNTQGIAVVELPNEQCSGNAGDKPPIKPNGPQNCGEIGNPVKLVNQRKVETIACLKHETAGMDINFGFSYSAPRTATLAPAQSGKSAWAYSYNRKLLTYADTQTPPASYRRIQTESGEVYDFMQFGAGIVASPYDFYSVNGVEFGSLNHDPATNQFTYTYPNGEIDIYNAAGQLIKTQDRTGSFLSYTRTGNTQLDITSQPSGRTVRVTLADQGGGNFQPTSVIDLNPPSGTPVRQASIAYINGLLSKYTDISGRVAQFRYDSEGRMTQHYNQLNNPDVLGAAAKFTQVNYACPTCQNVSSEVLANGSRLDFTPVTGQAWTLEVKETGIDGAIRFYRYTFDQRDLMTRAYVPNSTTKYSETEYDGSANAINVWDPERRRTSYEYDSNGFATKVRVWKDATTYDETQITNNDFGQATQIVEPSGTMTNMGYEASKGFLTSIERVGAGLTQKTEIAYEPVTVNGQSTQVGLPTKVTLPDNTINTQTYDTLGYPSLSTFDAGAGRLNITESTTFDARGYLIATVDKRGIRSTFEYANNPANGQYGNLGIPSASVYDTNGVNGLTARNIRTETYLDAMLNPTRVVNDAGAGRKNATALASYSMIGSEGVYAPTQLTDPLNRITRMEYDGLGQLSKLLQVGARASSDAFMPMCSGNATIRQGSVSDRMTLFCYTPEGWHYRTVLDDVSIASESDYAGFGDGMPRAVTDARGVRSTMQYDGKGRVVKVITGAASVSENGISLPAINGETTYSYDSNDRTLSVIAKLASGTRTLVSNQYDGLGRLSQTTDGAGNQTRYSYDSQRNFLLSTTAGGNNSAESVTVQNIFDRLGRLLTSRTDPSGKNLTTAYGYAASSDRWLANTVTNPRGKATRYAYNSLGNLQSVTDPVGSVWNYSTNNLGDLTQVDVPGSGANTDYNVNVGGQITSLSRNGQSESWLYNVDGSVQRYIDFSGQIVTSAYDLIGRLASLDYAGTASDPSGARSDIDSIQYWRNGAVRSVTSKPNGSSQETTSYNYDASNRLISTTRNGRQVSYAYNLDNTLSQINYWTRGSVNYGYGANSENNGLVRSVTPFDRAASSYTYTSANQLSRVQRPSPNGMLSQFGYDRAARLTSIDHTGNSALVHSAAYELDNNGNRTKLTENYPAAGAASAQTVSQHFGYDELDRLIRAEYGAIGGAPKREENFLYDAVGNRTSVQQTTMQNTSDFNQDGTPDLAWRLYDNNVGANSIWVMGGANGDQFVRGVTSATPVQGAGSANWWQLTGDINGDGVNELLWRNMGAAGATSAGENLYWKLGGADNYVMQSFAPLQEPITAAPSTFADPNWVQEAVADMNRDGKGDIIWRNYSTGQNVVWFMGGGSDGQQRIGTADLTTVPINPASYNFRLEAAADFNRDGFTDLAWHDLLGGTIIIWYMGPDPITGNGTKIVEQVQPSFNGAIVTLPTGVNNLRMRGAADANKDGTPDLYWQYGGTGEVVIWYMADSGKKIGSFSSLVPRPPSPWWIAKGSQYARLTSENKLSFDASDRITSPGYSFDTNGNITASPAIIGQTATTYTYTAANKLLRTVKDGVTTEYQYDGSGNLIRKIRVGVTTDYVLDENRGLANVIGEITGSDDILYAFGPEGLHAQQRKVGSTLIPEYPLSDGLGSIKVMANMMGGVNRTESFDAWGVRRSGSGGGASAFGFTGEQGMEDGTTYLRARSYLPAMGRFLQRDTFAGFSGRPQSLNRYAYVEGNPTGFVDPSGQFKLSKETGQYISKNSHGAGNVVVGGIGMVLACNPASLATGVGVAACIGTSLQTGGGVAELVGNHVGGEGGANLAKYGGVGGDVAATATAFVSVKGAIESVKASNALVQTARAYGEAMKAAKSRQQLISLANAQDAILRKTLQSPINRLIESGKIAGGVGGTNIPGFLFPESANGSGAVPTNGSVGSKPCLGPGGCGPSDPSNNDGFPSGGNDDRDPFAPTTNDFFPNTPLVVCKGNICGIPGMPSSNYDRNNMGPPIWYFPSGGGGGSGSSCGVR